KTREKTREHYVTSLRKSDANSDFVTFPAGNWKVALNPSLFARRINVIFRSGSFSKRPEYAFPMLLKCQTTRSLRWLCTNQPSPIGEAEFTGFQPNSSVYWRR